MSCNHKKAKLVAHGIFPRPKKFIVDHDELLVYRCPTCKSVRCDQLNDYCYSKGMWSKGGKV